MDTGDYVVVINAEKVSVPPGARWTKRYTIVTLAFRAGCAQINLRDQLAKHPDRVLKAAVKGMLPHNRLGRAMFKKLKVYAGTEHPHAAHKPKKLEL